MNTLTSPVTLTLLCQETFGIPSPANYNIDIYLGGCISACDKRNQLFPCLLKYTFKIFVKITQDISLKSTFNKSKSAQLQKQSL